jgi:hypothetical protein
MRENFLARGPALGKKLEPRDRIRDGKGKTDQEISHWI